jgi:hypothetical protein
MTAIIFLLVGIFLISLFGSLLVLGGVVALGKGVELADRARLRDAGALTEEQVETAKARLAEAKQRYRVVLTAISDGREKKVARFVKRWAEEPFTVPMVVTPDYELSMDAAETVKQALEKLGGTVELQRVAVRTAPPSPGGCALRTAGHQTRSAHPDVEDDDDDGEGIPSRTHQGGRALGNLDRHCARAHLPLHQERNLAQRRRRRRTPL